MKILFGHVVKGFIEWFTTNEDEIVIIYNNLDEEIRNWFESIEGFALELFFECKGIE